MSTIIIFNDQIIVHYNWGYNLCITPHLLHIEVLFWLEFEGIFEAPI